MNKVVLITGGNKGLGRSCSLKFAKNGYDVIINYLTDTSSANSVKEEIIKKYNSQVLLIKSDIKIEKNVKNILNKSIKKFKKIDVLINNAGISNDQIIDFKTSQDFRKVIDTNLIGTFLMCKYIGTFMNKQGYGCIINVSSNNSIDSYYPESIDYDSSKAGINILTKDFAVYFSPKIRVNAIAPGWINTDMNKNMSLEFKEQELNKILLKRFANPDEIASVIYFLATDEAKYINGTIIKVDGGKNI